MWSLYVDVCQLTAFPIYQPALFGEWFYARSTAWIHPRAIRIDRWQHIFIRIFIGFSDCYGSHQIAKITWSWNEIDAIELISFRHLITFTRRDIICSCFARFFLSVSVGGVVFYALRIIYGQGLCDNFQFKLFIKIIMGNEERCRILQTNGNL